MATSSGTTTPTRTPASPTSTADPVGSSPSVPTVAPYPMPGAPQLPHNQVDWQPDPARAALLIHDMQRYFLRPFVRGQSPLVELLANTRLLREESVSLGMPVIYTAQPGDMTSTERGLLADFWGPGMRADPQHRDIVDELAPAVTDTVVTKWRYSAFHHSGLVELLREAGRDQLLLCGVYAHLGCFVTACDAFSLDIQPFFVADALADFSASHHRMALDYAASSCAATVSTRGAARALRANSPTVLAN